MKIIINKGLSTEKVIDYNDSIAHQLTTHYIDDSHKTCEERPIDLSYGKKPPVSLVPPSFIILISKAMEDGAKKRSPYNWRESKVSVMQLLDKVLRHTYKFLDGQNLDEESGLPELAHASADLAVLIDAIETKSAVDDRPKSGVTAQLIQKYSEGK